MERDRTFPPPVLRFSELKHIAKSPAHFRAAYTDPRDPSPVMEFGSLVHAVVLGGARVAVFDGDRRGGAWKEFKEANKDKEIITTAKDYERAKRVADAVLSNPIAAPLLEGEREVELAWKLHGRSCAGRIDVIGEDFLTELKTCGNSEPEFFTRSALRMAYHAQLAWYKDGARAAGRSIKRSHVVSVEVQPPFAVTPFDVTTKAIEQGRKILRLWLEREQNCSFNNVWPAYVQCSVPLDFVEDAPLVIGGEEYPF